MFALTPLLPKYVRRKPTHPITPIAHPDFRHAEPNPVHPSYLTSLDTQETNGRLTPRGSLPPDSFTSADPRHWGHSGHESYRRSVQEAFTFADTVTPSRITRYDECGSRAWVYFHTEGHPFRIHAACCKDRWCPSCQAKRAHVLRTNLSDKTTGHRLRFLTLTLRATGADLSTRVDQLYGATSALRRLPFWRRHVTGGAMFIELTWIPDTHNWHVHAHLLVQGKFIPHHALKACWRAVTEGSTIVDVRMPKSQRQVEHYVTKYVTKPVPQNVVDSPDLLIEAINALFRRRLCVAFGDWRGWRLLDSPQTGQCTPVMPLQQLVDLSRSGSGWAARILTDINTNLPSSWELEAWAQNLYAELFPVERAPPLFAGPG